MPPRQRLNKFPLRDLPRSNLSPSSRSNSPDVPCATRVSGQSASSRTSVVSPSRGKPSKTVSHSGSERSWTSLRAFSTFLDKSSSLVCPFKAVVHELTECIDVYESVAHGRDEFRHLGNELEGIFQDLRRHFSQAAPPPMTASIQSLCQSISKELSQIKEKQNRCIAKRLLEAKEDADTVLVIYRRIQGHLQRLVLNANLSMWKTVDDQITDTRLDRLNPVFAACYDSSQATDLRRGACTPGTRIDVLAQMHSWVYDSATGSVYWVNGMAGTGKTTIAYSFCCELEAAHNLGASFFCSRVLPECRDVNRIVPSIAYQLAEFSRPFRCALSRVLEKERNVHTRLLHIQFEMLVVRPLIEVQNTLPVDLVVVIDALDECDNKGSTGQILDALLTKTLDLPIKFFIASRPEPEIRDQIQKQTGERAISRLVLHEFDKGIVQADIKTYIRSALGPIKPSDEDISSLAQRAGILFIYAATVARYIGHDNFSQNPLRRLRNVLNVSPVSGNNPYKDIDELYTLILQAALEDIDLDDEERNDRKQVLFTVLCAQEPLVVNTISGLLAFHEVDRVHAALRPLWSVLHVVESNNLVTTLHASFPDYMFDPQRSKNHCCIPASQHHALAQSCFHQIMNTRPQFNICRLGSSYIPDGEIENLDAMVAKAVSSELYYACRYWAAHLERTNESPNLVQSLENFLSGSLLMWMEVMNLKKCMGTGPAIIMQAEEWCIRQSCPGDLLKVIEDAWRFIAEFISNPVSKCTAHIYVSMLSFWPLSRPIGKYYAARRCLQGMIAQGTPIALRQLPVLLASWPAGNKVDWVVWSPDSTRIALICMGRIQIWDSQTGEPSVHQFDQASTLATSIAFSPDGARLVSGSSTGSIHTWDARNGQRVLGPLEGHNKRVTSVTFSLNSARIASASDDKTIRMWDAYTGQSLAKTFRGHTGAVKSIAFSPDGQCLASGSVDKTIRVWYSDSGELVCPPLTVHTNRVRSVAFSPDGAYLISGSDDMTICMWDLQTGCAWLKSLKLQSPVTSVAFSPNSARIVSGSSDKRVFTWDARSGEMVLGPLEGHTGWVTSVSFSPDGARIVSSSADGSVRMWSARNSIVLPGSSDGHTARLTSVTFSLDGTRVISTCGKSNTHFWDARSGERMPLSFHPHHTHITSVAFSPNGTHIASGSYGGDICTWDFSSKHINLHLRSPSELRGQVLSLAFSPDGLALASGYSHGSIYLWNAQNGQCELSLHDQGQVWSIAFSPTGNRVISSFSERNLRIWDAQTGEQVLHLLEGCDPVKQVIFSPDGKRIVSSHKHGTVSVWDSRTGKRQPTKLSFHRGFVHIIAISPDGEFVASSPGDKTIHVWNIQTGQMVLGPLEGHDIVACLSFSPNGTRIVSGSVNGAVYMWDAQSIYQNGPSASCDVPFLWKIRKDGWVVDKGTESNLMIWVPPDLRESLLPTSPPNALWVAGSELVQLLFHSSRMGENWAS